MYFFYYVPVGINAELRRFPYVTYLLSFLCVAVFVLHRYGGAYLPIYFYDLIYRPGESGWTAAAAASFLHFGYVHIVSNLIYLLLFGRYIEDRMGPVLFLLLFLSSSMIGNVLQGLFNAHVLGQAYMGIIGASGSVSGILGALAVRFYASRLQIAYWVFMPLQAYTRAGRAEIPVILAVVLWFILQGTRSLLQMGGVELNVAHITHISGFLWGMGFAILLGEVKRAKIDIVWHRARQYLNKGEAYAAQGELLRYLSLRPDDIQGYAALARAMAMAGDAGGAKRYYGETCERLLEAKRRGEAENMYREAIRGFSDFVLPPDRHLDLAFGLERNLKPKLAVTAYENFARRYPFHREAPFALLRAANLHWHTFSDARQATDCYRRLISRYPDDEWVDFAKEHVRILSHCLL